MDPFRKKFLLQIANLKTASITGQRLKEILDGEGFIQQILESSGERDEEETEDKVFIPTREKSFLQEIYKKVLREIAERYKNDSEQDLMAFRLGHPLIKKK